MFQTFNDLNFEEGDRVECVKSDNPHYTVGKVYTIVQIDSVLWVYGDDNHQRNGYAGEWKFVESDEGWSEWKPSYGSKPEGYDPDDIFEFWWLDRSSHFLKNGGNYEKRKMRLEYIALENWEGARHCKLITAYRVKKKKPIVPEVGKRYIMKTGHIRECVAISNDGLWMKYPENTIACLYNVEDISKECKYE